MKYAIILGAAAAALVTLVVVAAAAADRGGDKSSFTVVEHATSDTVTDTGAAGDSVGDILTFANSVYDASNGTQAGSDNGECVRTVVGKAWECWWTTFLAGGQITVEGPFYDTGDSNLAITGGTGDYSRARGWMKLHARNAQGTEYDFAFHVQS